MAAKKDKQNRRYCIAYGCTNMNKRCPNLGFFSLPNDKERRHRWLTAIGREDLHNKQTRSKSYEVCQAHFTDSMLRVIKHLKPNAIPVYNLPDKEERCFLNEDYNEESSQSKESEESIEKPNSNSSSDENSDSESDPLKTQAKIPIARIEVPPKSAMKRQRKLAITVGASKKLMNREGARTRATDKESSRSKVPKKLSLR